MIVKSFEIKKINLRKNNFFLLYGKNNGLKFELIKNLTENYKKITTYNEKDILDNEESVLVNLFSKSFFEDEKNIIIKRATDKILKFIEQLIIKKLEDVKIFIEADNIEKKSKLRSLFEKEKQLICIPCYPDNDQTLTKIIYSFSKEKRIPMSTENINFLIKKTNGDREFLINELGKIESYCKHGKKINLETLSKLINLVEDHNITELANECLAGNKKKLLQILNENNLRNEDCIVISRTLLNKTKNLINILIKYKKNNNLEAAILTAKPPIFWKDKEIVSRQILRWSLQDLKEFMYAINSLELKMKRNLSNSINLLTDFLIENSQKKLII